MILIKRKSVESGNQKSKKYFQLDFCKVKAWKSLQLSFQKSLKQFLLLTLRPFLLLLS